jgi:glycogen debranching enzyme
VELVLDYNFRYKWNQSEILHRKREPLGIIDGYFIVEDVGVNAVYAAGWYVLADLASHFNATLAAECQRHGASVSGAIQALMWNETLGYFVTLYKDKDGHTVPSPVETVQSLFPLLLPDLPEALVERIVRTAVTNTSKFWLPYPVPSVSADAPQYTANFTVDLMWRGPTWPILNWFLMEGLVMHGYSDVAGVF